MRRVGSYVLQAQILLQYSDIGDTNGHVVAANATLYLLGTSRDVPVLDLVRTYTSLSLMITAADQMAGWDK